jgi:hypothetical protein
VIVRLLASFAALCVGVAGVVIVAVLLQRTPGPESTATSAAVALTTTQAPQPTTTSEPNGFPSPPPSAVVFMHQDAGTVLALAVTPGSGALELQASALGQSGHGTSGLRVSFVVGGRTADGVPCGAGCYRASVSAPADPPAIVVKVSGRGLDTSWKQPLPSVWPAPDATALVERAGRAWRSLRSLGYVEHLESDPQHAITSVWRIAAPDRVQYQVLGGYGGIVIGGRRWDRAPGGRWIESVQSDPLTQPVPTWTKVTNAHLLGSSVVRGQPVWLVSFFDPTIPAWFEVAIAKSTARSLDVHMMATAHFMDDAYGQFDGAPPITPP